MLHPEVPDSTLVDELGNGNARAFELIYHRYWQPLYRFAYQQLDSQEDAEEVIHDLMLSLWQNRMQVSIQNLRIYLFVATRNLVNKLIKAQINLRRYREYQLLHGVFESSQDISTSDELAQAIERVVRQMPEKTARVFTMSKLDRMPVKKIASSLQISEKAVEYHITKSLRLVRQYLRAFQSDN